MERVGTQRFGGGLAKKLATIIIAGFLVACVREFGKAFGLIPQNLSFAQDAIISIASLFVAYMLIWIATR